jgi:RecA-family ATPase
VHFADTEDAPFPFNIMRDECFSWLAAEISRVNPVLIIIDTMREVHGLNENESTAMQQVVSRIREAAPRSAILLVSHARKESSTEGFTPDPIDEQRGSGYIAGRMDAILRLTKSQILIKGRTIGDTHVGVKQDDETHMVVLADAFAQAAVEIAYARLIGESDRDLARRLHDRFPKRDYETCRSAIRRVLKKL